MGFGDLKSDAGLKSLDDYLSDKSYVEGLVCFNTPASRTAQLTTYCFPGLRYVPSQADVAIFNAVGSSPNEKFVNTLRWFNQLASYNADDKLA